ncbi:hypothetical protein [Streptomyces bacillaris]
MEAKLSPLSSLTGRASMSAQRDDPVAGLASPEYADDTVSGDAGTDLVEVQGGQVVRDQLGRVDLAVGQFRVLVEMVSPLDDLPLDRLGLFVELGVDRITAHVPAPPGRSC